MEERDAAQSLVDSLRKEMDQLRAELDRAGKGTAHGEQAWKDRVDTLVRQLEEKDAEMQHMRDSVDEQAREVDTMERRCREGIADIREQMEA